MSVFLLSLFALAAPAGQTFTQQQLSVSSRINGIDVTTSTKNGWVTRVAMDPQSLQRGPRRRSRSDGFLKSSGAPAPTMAEELAVMDEPMLGGLSYDLLGQGPMKAGTTDDNHDFGEFIEFLDTWKGRPGIAGNHIELDVSDRSWILVEDQKGSPLPGAELSVFEGDHLVWSGTTFGDGYAPFYPGLLKSTDHDYQVKASFGGTSSVVGWNGEGAISVDLALTADLDIVDLDVVFVIDTTGSMSDEIQRIKDTLLQVTSRVQSLETPVNLRYGAVLYRDINDEYLTKHLPLTSNLEAFDQKLQEIRADGGGDGPESLNQGLAVAVGEMQWRDNAAKMMFMVADAPPHMDYEGDNTYAEAASVALSRGIRIHTVAASGLGDFGSLVYRQSAQLTRGKFVFIEYGSTAASAADHGVTGTVHSNNLDAILYQQIEDEVVGWGARNSGSEVCL